MYQVEEQKQIDVKNIRIEQTLMSKHDGIIVDGVQKDWHKKGRHKTPPRLGSIKESAHDHTCHARIVRPRKAPFGHCNFDQNAPPTTCDGMEVSPRMNKASNGDTAETMSKPTP